jgi:hypothetical protein
MKKQILLGLILLNLTNCSYKPIIDTSGRSGTFPHGKSEEMTNDIQHCKMLAESSLSGADEVASWLNNNVLRVWTLGLTPKEERTRENYTRRCLVGRGHSVIN